MNNSLPRLIDGMVETMRREIIPHVDGDFARGQAYGIIYMLNTLKLRASWSNALLAEPLRALEELSNQLEALSPELAGAPLPHVLAPANLALASDLEAARDAGDQTVCELIDWLAADRPGLSPVARAQAERLIDGYLNRQSRYEISTSAKPMFVEMSGGAEKS